MLVKLSEIVNRRLGNYTEFQEQRYLAHCEAVTATCSSEADFYDRLRLYLAVVTG